MSPQVSGPVRPIALIGILLVATAGIGLGTQATRAAECLTAPKAHTPKGSHWYYHRDRATQRKCWFLRGPNGQQQATTTDAGVKPTTSHTTTTSAKSTNTTSCLAAPNHAAPKGSHWYYHLDRATKRKCWHLRGLNGAAEAATATPKADAVPAASTTQAAQPTVAGTPAAPAKQDADSVWSAPPAKPQSAILNSDARDDRRNDPDANRMARAEAPVPATSNEPAASAGVPQDSGSQAVETAAAPDKEAQDPPVAVDAGKTITPALPTRDTRAKVAPSPKDPPTSGAATSIIPAANAATVNEPNADQGENISRTMSDSAATPLGIISIVALALVVAGILYRILLRLLAMRGPRVIIDRSAYDWGEERYAEASTVPQQVTEDLAPSLAPPVAEMKYGYPRVTGDAWLRDGRGSRIVPAKPNGEHDEQLAAFMRDLDQLLHTRNGK